MRFFTVPMLDGEEESQELNRFLATHRVLTVERHFVSDGLRSAWAICVSHLDRGGRPASEQGKRVDFREILSESDFAVFVKLRNLRKAMADKEGLPAYTFFTNEQLAAMVQQRVTSLKGLEEIPGVGSARVKKHGAAFLEILRTSLPTLLTGDHANGDSAETGTR
ncbi:MAG: HRDC domain-containing protein [Isosphaeraceae bacterium]|nr:HRDC domain-containing protein [Isosphaeraceae bacterium]